MLPRLLQLCLALTVVWVRADVYLNNPRGSNNKLSEQSNNVQNANRLFNSQNNAAGGYQVGDDCKPVCQSGNSNYDASKEGAMQGTMTYYQGSELYIEWLVQHGSGLHHPHVKSQLVLQYMCEGDNLGIRDGTKRGNNNRAGGQQEPPTRQDADDTTLGQHEDLEYYLACKARQRNQGLYTADQVVRDDRGATATRQNPNGNGNRNDRNGLECDEERDYYPYWHPTPWHDIAVLTSEPERRCEYYRSESQNVMAKGFCSIAQHNNPMTCRQGGGTWSNQPPHDEPAPECFGDFNSRDNHLGGVSNGAPASYMWRIPEHVEGRCVLRLRYNISSGDFEDSAHINREGFLWMARELGSDYFSVDHYHNDKDPVQRRRTTYSGGRVVLTSDMEADFVHIGDHSGNRQLQLQINTNQYGRTFEDRTHTFYVRPRPPSVQKDARIVNYNVRGRRGNIVQVYPSVEYDFVPPNLVVDEGTYLHFQWVGSDANPQGNAGNGRQGTDRSNLVQIADASENVPLPIEQHTLLFDGRAKDSDEYDAGRRLVDRFAYLGQDALVECDPESNNDQAEENCKQLNGASAYFDGGLVQMRQVGVHHIVSTRNNDFSNRSQKAMITVRAALASLVELGVVLTAVGLSLAGAMVVLYLAAAIYAYVHPESWLFSTTYRPRVLRWVLPRAVMAQKEMQRREYFDEERKRSAIELSANAEQTEVSERRLPPEKQRWPAKVLQRCRKWGLQELRLSMLIYTGVNLVVLLIGFLSNLHGGFEGSVWYPAAKAAGYTLDLNLAVIVLPTLKSLQTAIRSGGGTREWMPIDDPILFHVAIGGFVFFGAVWHTIFHICHMRIIANAGTSFWEQSFNFSNRCAPISGLLVLLLMAAMYATAMPCSRRATNVLTRRIGGYNLFWRVHLSWKWVYLLLMLHAPERLWIWFMFPALFVVLDRMLLAQRQRTYVCLQRVRLLSHDVINLRFHAPKDFTYQAGQYILLGWRGEWHPFTLTSAPEERALSVHIRAPNTLDWCSALRRRLTEEAPAAAAKASGADAPPRPQAGDVFEYDTHTGAAGVVYSQPCERVVLANLHWGAYKKAEQMAVSMSQSDASPDSFMAVLPDDAVVLQLSGPFGAPAQKVWQFETIMVVGSGIGVTPFASILRSVQLRAQQRSAFLTTATATGKPPPKRLQLLAMREMANTDDASTLEELMDKVVSVPRRVYFYWIVRSEAEVKWFGDLLASAAKGPAQGIIEINVFMTGEVEFSEVEAFPFTAKKFFGRPNWNRIFTQNKAQHQGEHIGVFLCGSPEIGKALSVQSSKHTDSFDTPNCTRFSFYKEYF